ncbi:hypothetical protein [Moorena producens]|nr:hypothetical protein [Moorena producens]
MQSLMGETTAVAHGGNPLWRRCIAFWYLWLCSCYRQWILTS